MKALWERHRPFLLKTAGGGIAFLILLSIATSYADVDEMVSDNEDSLRNLDKRVEALALNYSRTTGDNEVFGARFDSLIEKISTTAVVPDGNYNTEFARQKERVYGDFVDRANRIGLNCPVQKDVDMRESNSADDDEWRQRFYQLAVLDRVLNVCVDQQVDRITSIEAGSVTFEEVSDKEKFVVARYPVTLEIVASYSAILGFLDTFQRDRDFVSVEIDELKPDETARGRRVLEAKVTFVGVEWTERKDPGRKPRGGGWRRGKR